MRNVDKKVKRRQVGRKKNIGHGRPHLPDHHMPQWHVTQQHSACFSLRLDLLTVTTPQAQPLNHFQPLNHILAALDDVAPQNPLLKAQQTKMCLHTWLKVCFQLWSLRHSRWQQGPLVVLFHCFGGRNRSTAAACAWLIIGHGFTAETAICHVLGPKRSLRPRKNRAYVPLALLLLQQARDVIVDAFDTLLRDRE